MAKILVCDDVDSTRQTITYALENDGHTVHPAATVDRALDYLRIDRDRPHHAERYAVVLIDLRFENYPDATRIADAGLLIFESALQNRFLESIILTAYPSAPTASEAVDGAFAYVAKGDKTELRSFFIEDLLALVKKAVDVRGHIYRVHTSLMQLDDLVAGEDFANLPAETRTKLNDFVREAESAYGAILRARGHHLRA